MGKPRKTWRDKLADSKDLPRVERIEGKYPGGLEAQRARLEAEGHAVVVRGKRLFVAPRGQRGR